MKTYVAIMTGLLLSGCSAPSAESFNREVNARVKVGMTQDEATKKLTENGYKCEKSDHTTCVKTVQDNLMDCHTEYVRLEYKETGTISGIFTNIWSCGWGK